MKNHSPVSRRGFTLVEILIVVIILGILAAIVIPQFTNASNDARNNSVASTLQTMRSQIELFKIQHADTPPDPTGFITVMTGKTNPTDLTATAATGTLGPYLQTFPTNPVNGFSTVANTAGTAAGWIYTVTNGQYTVSATNTTGTAALTY
ncbi:MAG TPA: prepilin-type N-terminal cleavage/methylation domain-containing protein [Phycisphaerae bacterium]|nr:prepilin-type N-terminal cleavage/methylation domain-containing protein [Phycisphaerae bacterium]